MAFKHIPLGDQSPEKINVIIEITRGSQTKYEYDEELDVIRVDRVLSSPFFYPANYGFIPHTRSLDGDHLDALVLISTPIVPGTLIEARPIGVLDMIDAGEPDAKIIAVADCDPRMRHIVTLGDMCEAERDEIEHFFAAYKTLEKKEVKITGWQGIKEAHDVIREANKRFKSE